MPEHPEIIHNHFHAPPKPVPAERTGMAKYLPRNDLERKELAIREAAYLEAIKIEMESKLTERRGDALQREYETSDDRLQDAIESAARRSGRMAEHSYNLIMNERRTQYEANERFRDLGDRLRERRITRRWGT